MASSARRGFAFAFVVATLASAHTGFAEPTPAEKETARGLMDQGDAKADAKDWRGALAAYQSAHALVRVPTTGVEVAKMQERLGMLIEARDAALAVTRMARAPHEPALFERARADAMKLADELAERVPSLRVTIVGAPPSLVARLEIDGVLLSPEATRLPIKVNPGKHAIGVRAEGYESDRWDAEIAERTVAEITLHLTAVAKTSPPVASSAPPVLSSAPVVAPMPPAPPPAPASVATRPTWAYVALGAAGVGLTVGAIAGVLSASKTSSLKSGCDGGHCPVSSKDDLASATTLANVSNVGFAVAVLGAGVGVYGLFVAAPSVSSAGVRVDVVIGSRTLDLRGRF